MGLHDDPFMCLKKIMVFKQLANQNQNNNNNSLK